MPAGRHADDLKVATSADGHGEARLACGRAFWIGLQRAAPRHVRPRVRPQGRATGTWWIRTVPSQRTPEDRRRSAQHGPAEIGARCGLEAYLPRVARSVPRGLQLRVEQAGRTQTA